MNNNEYYYNISIKYDNTRHYGYSPTQNSISVAFSTSLLYYNLLWKQKQLSEKWLMITV